MNNAKRMIMDAERVLLAYGARRAPYETEEKAAAKLAELFRMNCSTCAFKQDGGIEFCVSVGLKCHDGFAAWLRSEADYV
jgi:hypothetical protein